MQLETTGEAEAVLATLVNVRDVATASLDLVEGMLLRSDAPFVDDLPVTSVEAWPPQTVVDLRDPAEKGDAHPYAGHSSIAEVPLFAGNAGTLEHLPGTLSTLYTGMLSRSTAGQIIQAISTIAHDEPPVLVHCAAGKDRTGVVIALTLMLVGIDRAAIVADYVRTNDAMPHVIARLAATRVEAVQRFAEVPPELLTAPAYAMEEFLDVVDEHLGGASGWFLSNGGRPETITALEQRLRR
jgi:hypothetical protein